MGTILLVAGLAACGTSREGGAADSAALARQRSTSAAVPTDSGALPPACPMEGDWTPCAVEERLERAGVVLERQEEPVQHPFLQVPGVRYFVGNEEHELQVFLYPSAEARERDTSQLDSATVSPRGTRVTWRTPPALVTSNNLAAVILSVNDRTVERLTLALGAGLPAAER